MCRGALLRISWAREPGRNGDRGSDREGSSGAFETAQEHSSHQGPKRAGFGIPSGFLPDAATGYYINADTGYYYDASTKLYYHPTTQLWCATRAAASTGGRGLGGLP